MSAHDLVELDGGRSPPEDQRQAGLDVLPLARSGGLEQLGDLLVAGRRLPDDAGEGRRAAVDRREQCRRGHDPGGAGAGAQRGELRTFGHRHRLHVADDGDVDGRLEDRPLRREVGVERLRRHPHRDAMSRMPVAAQPLAANSSAAAATTAARVSSARWARSGDR